jgi:putative tryptophan/tyrosine transport system substrate-binding protein
MRRRELIVRLGAAAVPWPLAARAQQKAMPVIGYLGSTSPGPYLTAYRQGLSEMGYVEGQNLAIEYRWAEGRIDRLPTLAADLVDRKVDLIAAFGGIASARRRKMQPRRSPLSFSSALIRSRMVWSSVSPGRAATSRASPSLSRRYTRNGSSCFPSWSPRLA